MSLIMVASSQGRKYFEENCCLKAKMGILNSGVKAL
jgi:hypothetical protein